MDIGAQLRSSREGRRLSLETVARTIRVQPRVLVAIERNDSAAIPPRPFGRGFVRAYAREVGLNPDQTVRDYFEQFAPLADAPVAEARHARAGARRLPFDVFPSHLDRHAGDRDCLIGAGLLVRVQSSRRETRASWARAEAQLRLSRRATLARRPCRSAACAARAPRRRPSRAITVVIEATRPVLGDSTHRRTPRALPDAQAGREVDAQRGSRGDPLAGNAAGLTWTINGRAAGPFGSPGAVRTVTVTPANASSIR